MSTSVPSSAAMAAAGSRAASSAVAHGGSWFCTQVGASCTCVESGELNGDSCDDPKPTCCFELVRLGTRACTCWPTDSDECKSQSSDVPDAKPTATCPPA